MRLFHYCFQKEHLKKIIGIEIQDEAVDLARRNVEMNDLNDQIEVVHGDIKDVIKELPKSTADCLQSTIF